MADESILTPGYGDEENVPVTTNDDNQYLLKDNYLSEFETETEKSVVRENLNIYPKDSIYTKEEVGTLLLQYINDAINNYLQMDDPHGILPQVEQMIEGMVKQDGSTPFTSAQSGQTPYKDEHLTTKKYVDQKIQDHLNTSDPHGILDVVTALLNSYVKTSDVYSKSQLYTQLEVNNLLKSYVKQDGSTPFRAAQLGIDPTVDSHLATKRYADKILYNHMIEVDPHHFITILNQRLAAYAKLNSVYTKSETYSRTQIDSIINQVVQDFVALAITGYQNQVNNQISTIKSEYVKKDGTTPFTAPQSGVEATDDSHLVTLSQLNTVSETLTEAIDNKECYWITSGPIESTVGHFEDNTEVPNKMTCQQVFDAIFYGKAITITAPEYASIGSTAEVTVCVHGSSGLIDYVEIYQDDELIYTLPGSLFDETGCVTVESNPIYQDTEFKAKVYYTNGTTSEASTTTICHMPIFVGLLPKWKFGNTITMDYLIELAQSDTTGTQNQFVSYDNDTTSITFKYQFEDSELRHPFIVVPESYPDLVSMTTSSQSFGLDAFDVIDMIPLTIENVGDIVYTIYIYRQALSRLNQEVTFNFESV